VAVAVLLLLLLVEVVGGDGRALTVAHCMDWGGGDGRRQW